SEPDGRPAGVVPEIVTPGHRSARSAEAPGALDMQGMRADGPVARRSDVAEVKHKHVRRPADDGKAKPDQRVEAARLQRARGGLPHGIPSHRVEPAEADRIARAQ